MIRRTFGAMLLLVLASVLAACSNPSSRPAAQTNDSTSTPPAPAVATTVAAPTASGSVLEAGRTPEGYHTLGSANAPVTLVMYSDFF